MARKTRSTPPQGESTPQARMAPNPRARTLHDAPQDPQELEPSAPVTPSPQYLSTTHQRFCQEYLVDLNLTQAYLRTYTSARLSTAQTESRQLLNNPKIALEIQRLLDDRAQVTGITADRALVRLWDQAMADKRELVEVRVGACRHCWGLYHQFQYTEAEFARTQDRHIADEAKRHRAEGDDFVPASCPERGGTGFSPNRQPNPDCPECHGDGSPRTIIKDMRKASPGALALFMGVKYDKEGRMQVLLESHTPALRMVLEHLGLLNDKLPGPSVTNPLEALLEEIRGRHGAGTALAVVHDDPEARRPADGPPKPAAAADRGQVQDVQPKPSRTPVKPIKSNWRVSR